MSVISDSLARQQELSRLGNLQVQNNRRVPTGYELETMLKENRDRILSVLGANQREWDNWRWQLRQRINRVEQLAQLLPLSKETYQEIEQVAQLFRWAITPYYLSLIDPEAGGDDPIFKQVVPRLAELNQERGTDDPMLEAECSPVKNVTRRYPDRLIINVTNRCASYCRHCQRRRYQHEAETQIDIAGVKQALDYIREHEEIRDVLITGGDALLISLRRLQLILEELDKIPHVEIKRLGTRVPVFCPQRIDKNLVDLLKQHQPIYLNTQFNHPREITPASRAACNLLADNGIVLGNQSVLLKGINDDEHVLRRLNQQLLVMRVRPYYLFQAKEVAGTTHFVVPFSRGLELAASLRGFTSGLANPLYIVNAPGGQGKIPLMPEYYLGTGDGVIYFKTWQGRVIEYPIYD